MPKREQLKPQAESLHQLELKANLNVRQRKYLEILKSKMKKILGNKTKQELAQTGDLMSLQRYRTVLEEVLHFLQTKEIHFESPKSQAVLADVNDLFEKYPEGVGSFVFSKDAKHCYVTVRDNAKNKWKIITDIDKVLLEHNKPIQNFILSDNAAHFAAIREDYEHEGSVIGSVIHDKIVEEEYVLDTIAQMTLSPNGEKLALILEPIDRYNDKFIVLENGETVFSQNYPITDVVYSPDSNKRAIIYQNNDGSYSVQADGQSWVESYYKIKAAIYSPDGERLAVVDDYENDDYENIVINDFNIKLPPDIDVVSGLPVFSPDSKKIAYVARRRHFKFTGKPAVSLAEDDQIIWPESLGYKEISNITYSDDGKNIAAVVVKAGDTSLGYQIALNGQLIDSEVYDLCQNLSFSPDGKELIFVALKDNQYIRVVADVSFLIN